MSGKGAPAAGAGGLPPRISVIVPAYRPRKGFGDCISSIVRSGEGLEVEVLIVDSSEEDAGPAAAKIPTAAHVRLERSPHRLFPGEARHLGVGLSRGEIIAFTDSDCIAAPDWLPALLRGLEAGAGAVCGGAVENGTPESFFGTAEYLSEFGDFTPRNASRRGERFVPTCNMALYRDTYLAAGGFPPDREKGSDVAFGRQLREMGADIAFLSDAVVTHLNRTGARDFVLNQFRLGKGFAANILAGNQPFSKAAGNAALRPFLLILVFPGRLYRIVSRVLRNGEASPPRLLLYLPGLAAGALAFAAGCAARLLSECKGRAAPPAGKGLAE